MGTKFKIVGTSCLKDFFNCENAQTVANRFLLVSEIEQECREYSGGGGISGYSIRPFLAATLETVRTRGWVSQGEASSGRKVSSGGVAWDLLRVGTYRPKEADMVTADKIVQFIVNLPGQESFHHNLRVIARSGYVTAKQIALAASMVVVYDKNLQNSRFNNSVFLGTVGDTLQADAIVTAKSGYNGAYGPGTRVVFDIGGSQAVWFTNTDVSELQINQTYAITAIVKKHEEFSGTKQTILKRVTVEKQ